jgi:hypothetical protein
MHIRSATRAALVLVGVAAVTAGVAGPVSGHFGASQRSSVAGAGLGAVGPSASRPDSALLAAARESAVTRTRTTSAQTSARTDSTATSRKAVAKSPTRSTPQRATKSKRHASSGPTSWAALNAAIARIPTYRSGVATWVVLNTGWLATTDWFTSKIYISPTTPTSRLYDVAVHEWSHILSVRAYGGNVNATIKATRLAFGGSGLTGSERAADCMAKLQGASYLHYTQCTNPAWRASARLLLAGQRLR